MIGMTNAGAGGGLKLKVKGGATAPANPVENMIWVETSDAITDVIVSYDAPLTPATGAVWLRQMDQAGNQVPVDRKGNVILKIGSANQFDGTVWVGKDANIYHSSAWEPLVVWAYRDGNKFSDLTGGYRGVTSGGAYSDRSDTEGYLYLYDSSGTGWRSVFAYTYNTIDMTHFSKLHMECNPTQGGGPFTLAVTPAADKDLDHAYAKTTAGYGSYEANVVQTVTLDISAVNQAAYICAYTSGKAAGTANARLKIYKFWFT